MGPWCRATVALALALVAACSSPPTGPRILQGPPREPVPVDLVVVYPVYPRFPDARALDALGLTWRLMDAMGGGALCDLMGPDEFVLEDYRSTRISSASNALYLSRREGYDPTRVAMIRVWVDERSQTGTAAILDTEGARVGARVERRTSYEFHGELWRYVPQALLMEVVLVVEHDPFADAPDWDPRPELGRGIREVAKALDAGVTCHTGCPAVARWTWLAPNPAMAEGYSFEGLPTLSDRLQELDPLMAEAARWRGFQYLLPSVTLAQVPDMAKLPPGLVVMERPGRGLPALGPMDVLTRVGDTQVRTRPALARALTRAWREHRPPTMEVWSRGRTVRLPGPGCVDAAP